MITIESKPTNYAKILYETIRAVIETSPFSYDTTKHGRIVSKTSAGVYEVNINEQTYHIKSQFKFDNGEKILVLFPGGQSSELYIYPNKP